MSYTISEDTAKVLDLIKDFENLIDRTATAVGKFLGPDSGEEYCTQKIYPAAAIFRQELESLLIQQIEDKLQFEDHCTI